MKILSRFRPFKISVSAKKILQPNKYRWGLKYKKSLVYKRIKTFQKKKIKQGKLKRKKRKK